ncbi:MAG: ComF family protein [Deltaproteobacteria bacterium]|nr:ComF family protein [Deltaproteobacteria bacterium]
MNVKKIIHSLLNIFYNQHCISCKTPIFNSIYDDHLSSLFCPVCKDAILRPYLGRCTRCADQFENSNKNHLCSSCIKHPPQFKKIYPAFLYGGPIADAVLKMKFEPCSALTGILGKIMISEIKKRNTDNDIKGTIDIIIPIPLHRKRLKQRGFNQSALIAKSLSKEIKIPVDMYNLRRNGNLPPQTGKSRKERLKRLEGVFYLKKPNVYKDKNILLLDDVVTTTATVRAATKMIIEQGGAKSVTVICLARAI